MSSKQITALLIILLYMVLTIVIGLVVSKRKAKKKAEQSNEDFLMAGKSLGPLALTGRSVGGEITTMDPSKATDVVS
jgi:solute:Na+ symporter, SSS family